MAINIEALINSLGKTYQDIFDIGLIPYKTKPTGFSGDSKISLDMVKEGVYLSFHRKGRTLKEITLTILDDEKIDWVFPNELPSPLQKSMSRQWVHEHVGEPLRSSPPEVIMKRAFGWTDLYEVRGGSLPTSMQISYDTMDNVRSVTYLLTSELRW
jgi:hypothetical protein